MSKGTMLGTRLSCCTLLAASLSLRPVELKAQQVEFENTLMPQPARLTPSTGGLILSTSFAVNVHDTNNPLLQAATQRLLTMLEAKTGIQLDRDLNSQAPSTVSIEVQDQSPVRPHLGVDESYILHIDSNGVRLQAKTVFGAMDGLETLFELVQVQGSQFILPAMDIVDAPRFPWRGLMLDPGRHFLSVDQVLRTLDGMAAVKLNVLHWHLSEDQGFRIESRRFPNLHQLGSNGLYYTQQQVRQIVQYATERGIRILPEFDIPGHSTSWMVGYPELSSQPGPYKVDFHNGIHNAAMDPTRDSTYEFLDKFFGEMAELFPDEYFHIGGDESNGKDWLANPAIVQFMHQHNLKDKEALQAYFNHRVQQILAKHGKQMVGWDEVLHADLSPDVVIQNWHGTEFLVNAARQGHRVMLSKPYYLDHMYSAADMYAADPVPTGSSLTPEQQQLVVGGEACMWGEQVTDLTADSRIWPRSAAVAERFWSPATTRDVANMYGRLAVMSLRLDALRVTQISTPQRGLRQLAGGERDASALTVFTSVLQPVDFHERAREQHTSERTPIGRLVDFTVPDPPARHELPDMVHAYLETRAHGLPTQTSAAQLRSLFQSWLDASPTVNATAEHSPLLAEVSIRRAEFPELARLGLQSLDLLASARAAKPDWASAQQALLTQAAQHAELVDFIVLDALGDLLHASAQNGSN